MQKQIVQTNQAPAAIGPYEQAVRVGDFLYTSGQIALDPASGTLVGDNVEQETEQVMKNLEAILQAAGLSFDNVIKTTVYLADLADFAKVNAIYERCFAGNKPARSCVQVAALPKGARVEIDAIAVAAS